MIIKFFTDLKYLLTKMCVQDRTKRASCDHAPFTVLSRLYLSLSRPQLQLPQPLPLSLPCLSHFSPTTFSVPLPLLPLPLLLPLHFLLLFKFHTRLCSCFPALTSLIPFLSCLCLRVPHTVKGYIRCYID